MLKYVIIKLDKRSLLMNFNFENEKLFSDLKNYADELENKEAIDASSLDTDETLLVIVDMIKGFCVSGALASTRSGEISPNVADLINKLPKAKLAFIRDCHSADAVEFNAFPSHCTGDEESELVDELKNFSGIDIPKNSTNGFFALSKAVPNLTDYKNIVVVGVCTDICVMQLALSLRAYINETNKLTDVVTFIDCVETYDAPWHSGDLSNIASMKLMEQSGVKVYKTLN